MQNNFKYEIFGGNKTASINVNKREAGELIYLDLNIKFNNEIPEKTVLKCVIPATDSLAIWSNFDRTHI